MIALAAYTPHKWHDIGGHLTARWTRRPESHVEIVIEPVVYDPFGAWCYSSSLRGGGVRSKVIDLTPRWWRVIPIEWRDEEAALRVFEQHKGKPYGWMDLITQHVLRLPVDDPGLLCSELCALMLGLPESTARGMSPGALVEYVLSRDAK
jgi:hypothetical protein